MVCYEDMGGAIEEGIGGGLGFAEGELFGAEGGKGFDDGEASEGGGAVICGGGEEGGFFGLEGGEGGIYGFPADGRG